MRKVLILGVAFGMVAVFNAACTGDDDGHNPPDSITISGGTTVVVGSSLQLTATAVGGDHDGEDITADSTWSSSSSGNATVSASGLVAGVSTGSTVIMAEHDGVVGQVTITVTTGAAATFNATINGDWTADHGTGNLNYYVRLIDDSTDTVVPGTCGFVTAPGVFSVTRTGAVQAGKTYRAQALADLNANGMADESPHKYETANQGPAGANLTFTVTHGSSAPNPTWTGTACP